MGSPLASTSERFSPTIPLIVATASFMETLDGTVVNTALPTMASSFGETPLAMTIGITSYLVAMAACIPAAGWFAERFGARTVFACAVALFTIASLACGIAPGLTTFVIARVFQGAAAAFMSPVGRIVVLEETPTHQLLQAIGTLTWPALIAPVIGPVLGGAIISVASWRWIFLLNLPIGIAGVLLVLRFIPQRAPQARKPFDLLGFALTGLALAAVVVGLNQIAESSDGLAAAIVLVAAGAALGAASVWHARRAAAPILSLAAVRVGTFFHASLGAGLSARIVNIAAPFLLPLMFQLAFGFTALHAGSLVLAYMAGNLLVKTVTIALIQRFGYRLVLIVNGFACAALMLACGFIQRDTSWLLIDLVLFASGASRSLHLGAITTMAFVEVTPAQRAGASALATMLMQLCQALAVAGATMALSVSRSLRGAPLLAREDFRNVWFALAVAMTFSAWRAVRLAPRLGRVGAVAMP